MREAIGREKAMQDRSEAAALSAALRALGAGEPERAAGLLRCRLDQVDIITRTARYERELHIYERYGL